MKSFVHNKGYGFIIYEGQDVFLHQKDSTDGGVPVVGDVVNFDIEESPNKPGSYKASNVTGCTGAPAEEKGKGCGKGKGAVGTGACTGQVKSFAEVKAWGFVTVEGEDVFIHMNEVKDGGVPKAGDFIQFDVEENPQKPGTMRAKNITGGTGWPSLGGFKGDGKGKGGDMWGGYGGGCDFGGWGPYGGCGGYGGPWGGGFGGGFGGGWGCGGDPWGGKGGFGGGWGGDWGGKGKGKGW